MALSNLSDWYSHPETHVLKLTKMPEGYPDGFKFAAGTTPNTADYHERGWCFKESSVAAMVKPSTICLDLGKLSDAPKNWSEIRNECRVGRAAPVTPEDFAHELENKSFTSKKADLPTVAGLYKAAFSKRFSSVDQLTYSGLGWGDAGLVSFSKVLGSGALANLKKLRLDKNNIGDAGVIALANGCATGGLAKLTLLLLDDNQIGDAGATALADVCAEGALAKLKTLSLSGNNIGDPGLVSLADAGAKRAFAKLKTLWLDKTQIGDAGVTAVADVCAMGGLPKLKALWLSEKHVSDAGITAWRRSRSGFTCFRTRPELVLYY